MEYGSSAAVAWAREDFCTLKATSQFPGACGVGTIARGGIALADCLSQTEASWGVLGKSSTQPLQDLFSREALYHPACAVSLPAWEILKEVLCRNRFEKSLDIAAACHNEAVAVDGKWDTFVALYRYVTMQLMNWYWGPRVPFTITSLEDISTTSGLGEFYIADPYSLQKQKGVAHGAHPSLVQEVCDARPSRGWPARVLNFPCQNSFDRCGKWHFINSSGIQLGNPTGGGNIPKKCRLRMNKYPRVKDALILGGGLSGVSAYYLFGLLGKSGTFCFLARDYSKGLVFEVLHGALQDVENQTYPLPYGSFYLYGKGCDPKVSIDSLVLLEILLRSDKPDAIVRTVLDAAPVPYEGPYETHVIVSLSGEVQVQKVVV